MIFISQELLDDAIFDHLGSLMKLERQRHIANLREMDRLMDYVSDEVWEYDKEQDTLLRQRMEQHAKAFGITQ